MMSFKGFAFAGLVGLSLAAAACEGFLPAEDEDEDETPTPTNTATSTPSAAPTPVTTTDGDIVTIDWGTIALDAGESPRFDFTAPAGTISIDFMAIGAAADAAKIFGFFSLTSPAGTVINNGATAPARQAFAEGAMSFSLPSDDSAITQVAPGNYRFHVLAFDPATDAFVDSDPQVLVKIRTAPSGVPAGEIDVNVIVVEGVGINASQACTAGNPVLDGLAYAAADDPAALYYSIGMVIGEVTCYDLTGSSQFTDVNQDELSALFETSAGIGDQRINLFIVDSFSDQLGFAAGVAGSVPIPMQVNGTPRSGVAIKYDPSASVMGETIAHEMGHSLGLYHTSEFNAATYGYDPISDTPTCPTLGSGYGGSGCADDTNVMFPQLTGMMDSFTAGQATVIKPTVHIRRQGTPAFAPAATKLAYPPPERLVWEGPPIRCENGVMFRE